MGALHPKFRRRLGRKLRKLSAEKLRGCGQHSLADRLGRPGSTGRRRHHEQQLARRYRILEQDAEERRNVGRRIGNRNGVSSGVLPVLSPVPALVPAVGAEYFSQDQVWIERALIV